MLIRCQGQKDAPGTLPHAERRWRMGHITWALQTFLTGERLPEGAELLLQAIAGYPTEIDYLLTVRMQHLGNERVLQREKLP